MGGGLLWGGEGGALGKSQMELMVLGRGGRLWTPRGGDDGGEMGRGGMGGIYKKPSRHAERTERGWLWKLMRREGREILEVRGR